MGARGPAPKPPGLRLIEGGTARRGGVSHRPVNTREPKTKLASGEIPEEFWWLDALAKAFWMRRAPEVVRVGLLRVTDLESWAMCCLAWSDYVRGRREGWKTKDAEDRWKYWARKFGLTPADRGALELPPPASDDDDIF